MKFSRIELEGKYVNSHINYNVCGNYAVENIKGQKVMILTLIQEFNVGD